VCLVVAMVTYIEHPSLMSSKSPVSIKQICFRIHETFPILLKGLRRRYWCETDCLRWKVSSFSAGQSAPRLLYGPPKKVSSPKISQKNARSRNRCIDIRSEVLTGVITKSIYPWDVKPYSLVEFYLR
jgi:hypothetical protein